MIDEPEATQPGKSEQHDPLLFDAARFILGKNRASTAELQSAFFWGHPRAVRVMKSLEALGVVGPHEIDKGRAILVTLAELDALRSRVERGETSETSNERS